MHDVKRHFLSASAGLFEIQLLQVIVKKEEKVLF